METFAGELSPLHSTRSPAASAHVVLELGPRRGRAAGRRSRPAFSIFHFLCGMEVEKYTFRTPARSRSWPAQKTSASMQLRTRPPKFVIRALHPTITMPGFLTNSPELHSHVLLVSRSSKAFATSALASPTAKSHQNETVSSSTELDPTGNSKCNTLRNSKISSLTCLDNYILCN